MRFTDRGIAALKPKAERYEVWEDGRSGFGVRVAPSGRKSWIFMYRFEGRPRRMTLSTIPKVGLANARAAFANAKCRLALGEDPGAIANAEKKAERDASTVKQLIDEYLARSAKGLRSSSEVKRILERNVLPAWGHKKVKAIKRRDVVLLLDPIVDRGAPIMANRVLAWTRRMFAFAVSREIIEINPCTGIEAPSREIERERILSDGEIVALWQGLESAQILPAIRIAAKLILATGQRPGEVAGAALAEFDFDQGTWLLPAERSKNGRPHVVPLSPLAVGLVEEAIGSCARGGWLFPGRSGTKPLNANTIGSMFRRNADALGIPVPVPSDGATPVAARRERRRIAFSPHDLRRTAATRMTERGFPRFIVDRLLNHVEPGVGRVYDRYEYLREKRAALEAWALRLEEIITGRKAEDRKVVPLRPA
jgi:integrase